MVNVCKREPTSITTEYLFYPNDKSDVKFIENNNNKNNSLYDLLSKEFYIYFNEIRKCPQQFIKESKEYNLFEIFIKLKPCPEINLIENNADKIKKYIINSHFKKKSILEQEKGIKILLLNENIKDICLFQNVFLNNDMKENVWIFLNENEDDIDKIFDVKYNYLMIICIPLEIDTKILLSLIFYKE